MSVSYEPPRSSPASAQRYDSAALDTSLTRSDRSVRSMHSAPSLTNTGSTSFASSVLSTSTLNLNVHSIPLPNSPHVHTADDDDKENLRAIHPPPPDITVTSPERPQLKRMQSERTVAGSLRRLSAQGSVESGPDPHASWRVSEYGLLSDAYEEDENDNRTEEESISGSTDELGRTLFYRPSTDPAQVRPESELDPDLSAVLSAMSNASLVPNVPAEPAPLFTTEPEPQHEHEPQMEREPEPSRSPPTRPARPASLNLSDTNEPAPAPKTVDLSTRRRHSRMSSRDRLSMLLGISSSGSSPRTSLQGGRPSTPSARTSIQGRPGHSHNQSHSSGHTIGSGSISAALKGKAPLVGAPDEAAEEWVHVGTSGSAMSSAVDLGPRAGMSSAIELGRVGGTSTMDFGGGGIGTSSAIDLASGTRPRARTFSTHSRSRTISSYSRDEAARDAEFSHTQQREFSQDAADMCRSVWEDDDTEEWGKGWGRVRKWLGDEVGASTSTPAPKKRHVPKALSLASTINAFRTPSTITMSPLFGEGGLMGGLADKTMSSARRSPGPRDSLATPTAMETPKSGTVASRATGASRISFQSFFTAESKRTSTHQSAVLGTSTPTSAYVSLAVPSSARPSSSTSRHSSSFVSARSSSGSEGHTMPEPESPTITAKRFRLQGGGLEVPEMPVKSSKELFTQSGSSLGLELRHSTSLELSRSSLQHEDTTATITAALPSPPASPEDAGPSRVPNTYIAPLSPAPRRPLVPRALGSPKYASLHGRLGSPLRSGTTGEEGWAPMSPFMSPASTSPQAAGPPSPGWSPVSPFPQSPLRTPASPLLSPSFGAGPSSPLGMSMPMDNIYRTDVRPMSGLTESSYRPSTDKRGSVATSGAGWKRESDGTFAGRHSITNQPLLAPPPRMKTVRIVETGPGTNEVRVKPKRETGPLLPIPPPYVSTPVPRAGAIFKFKPGGPHAGPRMRVKRKEGVGAGFSPRAWFLMGFVLGPWCWMVGGWMTHPNGPIAALDVEKSGGRVFEGGQWVKRCRVATVVSGVVVFGGALVAVVWAVIGAR